MEHAALQYARVKTQGFYLEKDYQIKFCHSQLKHLEDYFIEEMKTEALNMLAELSCQPLPEREK